ncbi:MAG: esterase-like activity of phytase family protein [Hyphomicrobiaceae bacterium]
MISRRQLLASGGAGIGALMVHVAAAPGLLATTASDVAEPLEIKSQPLAHFSKLHPSQQRFGRLEFRGGLVLTSEHKSFGGLSDLVMSRYGQHTLIISDEGHWISAEIVYDGTRPAGLRSARIGPLRSAKGHDLVRKRNSDAEAMVLLDGSLARGTVLIGFERNHRVGRFPVIDGAVQAPTGYLKMPDDARRMKPNKGIEALTVLQGGSYKGSVLGIAERYPDPQGHHTGWIWVRGEPRRFAVRDIGEFDITATAALGDGSVLMLERRFRWTEGVKMRLRHLPAAQIAPGATIEGETLVEADMTNEIDNMEGIAVHTGPRSETVLTMVSDDNYNSTLQRTLLLQFTLHAEGLASNRAQ